MWNQKQIANLHELVSLAQVHAKCLHSDGTAAVRSAIHVRVSALGDGMRDLQDDGPGDVACFGNAAGAAAELAQVVQG
jgi:hypothetical protein